MTGFEPKICREIGLSFTLQGDRFASESRRSVLTLLSLSRTHDCDLITRVSKVGQGSTGNTNAGAVYVFVKPPTGWADSNETAKLTASDAAISNWFGRSVDISGDTIAVGAFKSGYSGFPGLGSAYVFMKPAEGWHSMTETTRLDDPDSIPGDGYGISVAIDGDTVVIGAYTRNYTQPEEAGVAFVGRIP